MPTRRGSSRSGRNKRTTLGPLEYVTSQAELRRFQKLLIELREFFTLDEISEMTWRGDKNSARLSHAEQGKHLCKKPKVRIARQDYKDILYAHKFLMFFVGFRQEVRVKGEAVMRQCAYDGIPPGLLPR